MISEFRYMLRYTFERMCSFNIHITINTLDDSFAEVIYLRERDRDRDRDREFARQLIMQSDHWSILI